MANTDLVKRLLASADEVEEFPHPSHCDHLHVAFKVMREAAGALAQDTPRQDSQHVLKAEAARPDATDRENPANASPVGGPMGVWQPAAAGPPEAPLFSLAADWANACFDTDPRDIWPQDQRRIDAARMAFLECVETVQRGLASNLGIVQVAAAVLHAKQEARTASDGAEAKRNGSTESPVGEPSNSGSTSEGA